MSSMLKKKGGPAFKPKLPARRQAPTAAPAIAREAAIERPSKTPAPVEAASAPVLDATATAAPTIEPAAPPVVQRPPTPAAAPPPPATEAIEPAVEPAASALQLTQPTQNAAQPRMRRSVGPTVAAPPPQPEQERESERPAGRQTRIAISSLLQSEESTAAGAAGVQAPVAPINVARIPAEESTQETAATPGRRGRSRAKAVPEQPPAAEAAPATVPAAALVAPAKRRYTRKKVESGASTPDSAAAGPSQPRQPRKRAAASESTDGSATPASTAPKRTRRERQLTPEDAESRTVDHRELRMEDLTKDLRIGKKFSLHDELVDRQREKRRRYRQERLGKKQAGENGGEGGDSHSGNEQDQALSAPMVTDPVSAAAAVVAAARAGRPGGGGHGAAVMAGPQFEIIDGNIVVNQASLVHDRHAAAAAEAGVLEEVEENDFTRQTTSNTYLKPGKLRGPNTWTEEETELFYRALSMFGTSFDLICRWFPGKSRRHIKMKFNREDKLRPDRITQALVGQHKVAIDVDEYMARTGQTLHATEAIDAEYAARQAEHDAEQQRIADEAAEILRKKREALFGPRRQEGEQEAGKPGEAGSSSKTTVNEDPDAVEEIDETDLPPVRKGRGRAGRARQETAGGIGM